MSSTNQSFLKQDQINHRPPINQEQYNYLLALLNQSSIGTSPAMNHVQASLPESNMCPMSGISYSNFTNTHHKVAHINASRILDMGAIYSPHLFTHNITVVSHTIKLPNGHTTAATHVGDVYLSTRLILKMPYVLQISPSISFLPRLYPLTPMAV